MWLCSDSLGRAVGSVKVRLYAQRSKFMEQTEVTDSIVSAHSKLDGNTQTALRLKFDETNHDGFRMKTHEAKNKATSYPRSCYRHISRINICHAQSSAGWRLQQFEKREGAWEDLRSKELKRQKIRKDKRGWRWEWKDRRIEKGNVDNEPRMLEGPKKKLESNGGVGK